MDIAKTKSLKNIEQRMQDLEKGSFRYQVLETAKNFKVSWISLGRALYSVWKDKFYKEWGYHTFDAYTVREIGVRYQTSMKLLRSYYFLEKEEPAYLAPDYLASTDAASVPGYESIDVLRLAKNKKALDRQDYAHLKKEIFENGKDAGELKRDLTNLIRVRQELEPEEAWQKRKITIIRRFLSTLRALKKEIELTKILPAPLVNETASLIKKLEKEIG